MVADLSMGKVLCIRILLVEIRRRLADQAGRLRRSRFRWRKLLADLSGEVELLLDNNPSSPGRLRALLFFLFELLVLADRFFPALFLPEPVRFL